MTISTFIRAILETYTTAIPENEHPLQAEHADEQKLRNKIRHLMQKYDQDFTATVMDYDFDGLDEYFKKFYRPFGDDEDDDFCFTPAQQPRGGQ